MYADHRAAERVANDIETDETELNTSGKRVDLAQEVAVLCCRVEELARQVQISAVEEAAKAAPSAPQLVEAKALNVARQEAILRRRRNKILGTGTLAEPLWDILLELYMARAKQVDVTVGNACLAASVQDRHSRARPARRTAHLPSPIRRVLRPAHRIACAMRPVSCSTPRWTCRPASPQI